MVRDSLLLGFVLFGAVAVFGIRGGVFHQWTTGEVTGDPLRIEGWPRQLSWDDFQNLKFAPVGQPQYAAVIDSGFGFPDGGGLSPTPRDGVWRFEYGAISVYMKKSHSWVSEDHRSDRVLEHEQMHLDITGLAAREWLDDLATIETMSAAEALSAGSRSFDRVHKKLRQVQRLFDHANRGRREAHGEWRTRIRRLMDRNERLPEPGELPGFSALGDE